MVEARLLALLIILYAVLSGTLNSKQLDSLAILITYYFLCLVLSDFLNSKQLDSFSSRKK